MGRLPRPAFAAPRPRRLTAYGGWVLLTLGAAILGLASLAGGVPGRLFAGRPAEAAWPMLLAVDAAGIAAALLVGPWRFVPGLRWRWPRLHRWLGRAYAVSALASASLTIILAREVVAGPGAATGLLLLGSAWLIATMLDMTQAWRGDTGVYRRWMAWGFALALATAGLRFCCVLGLPFAAGCLAAVGTIAAMAMGFLRAGGTAGGVRRDRHIRPMPRALGLGVEITIETLDGWDLAQAAVPHAWPGPDTPAMAKAVPPRPAFFFRRGNRVPGAPHPQGG